MKIKGPAVVVSKYRCPECALTNETVVPAPKRGQDGRCGPCRSAVGMHRPKADNRSARRVQLDQ